MTDWTIFAMGAAAGSILTAALLFWSVEVRLRGIRIQMEQELEELKRCVARAKTKTPAAPNQDTTAKDSS